MEPGASDVFTQAGTCNPRSTAFFASNPAAIITDGFEVFVQLVIAAITTEPSLTWSVRGRCATAAVSGVAVATIVCAASLTFFGPSVSPGRGRPVVGFGPVNESQIIGKSTRSCGRFGPETDGRTDPRSTSMSSSNVGVGSPSERNMPCALV